jgi:hypothetical protein
MKIFSVDFNAKIGRGDIFNPRAGTESLYKSSKDYGVRLVNVAAPKKLIAKSTILTHRNIHKYISPDGKTHKQIYQNLIDRLRHSTSMSDDLL